MSFVCKFEHVYTFTASKVVCFYYHGYIIVVGPVDCPEKSLIHRVVKLFKWNKNKNSCPITLNIHNIIIFIPNYFNIFSNCLLIYIYIGINYIYISSFIYLGHSLTRFLLLFFLPTTLTKFKLITSNKSKQVYEKIFLSGSRSGSWSKTN
jgi:hypothetical protein